MRDYEREIVQLKLQIEDANTQLDQLEREREEHAAQQERRRAYLSSREVLGLLEERQGRKGSMATIKRWADHGDLGEVIDERLAFPLLVNKQGNKRFLYPREDALRFLFEKGILAPRFEVLDRVRLKDGNHEVYAVVTAIQRCDLRFTYQVQLEATGDVRIQVAEEDLSLP
jgi:hypothetical protein